MFSDTQRNLISFMLFLDEYMNTNLGPEACSFHFVAMENFDLAKRTSAFGLPEFQLAVPLYETRW